MISLYPDHEFKRDVDTRAGELMQLLRQLRANTLISESPAQAEDAYDLQNKIDQYGKLGESLAQAVSKGTPLDTAFEERVHTQVEFEMRVDRLHGHLFEYEQLHLLAIPDGPAAMQERQQLIREVASVLDAHGQPARELRESINELNTSSSDEFFPLYVRNALQASAHVAPPQASNPPPAHVLDFPYPPQNPGTPSAQTAVSTDDARHRPPQRRATDLGR